MSLFKDHFKEGEAFEKFVEDVVFPSSHFKLLEKTHNYRQNASRYVESSLKPDFKFKSKTSGLEFYVEAKFRSRYNRDDKLSLMKLEQFHRCKSLDSTVQPVFLLVGTEGYPDRPKFISLIPVKQIDYPNLYRSIVHRHTIPMGRCPENALSINPNIKQEPVSSNLSNVTPYLPYEEPAVKRTNYLAWILGLLVLGVFIAFYLTQTSNSGDKIVQEPSVKNQVQEYYKALELNNVEVLDYYLRDPLDRWYDKRDVRLLTVKKEMTAYNKRYPIRKIEINWPTYKEKVLPNGDYGVSYDVHYSLKPQNATQFKNYDLNIKAVWGKDFKIKSMYEEKL